MRNVWHVIVKTGKAHSGIILLDFTASFSSLMILFAGKKNMWNMFFC